jgi:hypothetical protein
MQQAQSIANPFAMLLEPERVLRAVECSERLNRLHSRICRPLDKISLTAEDATGADADTPAGDACDD